MKKLFLLGGFLSLFVFAEAKEVLWSATMPGDKDISFNDKGETIIRCNDNTTKCLRIMLYDDFTWGIEFMGQEGGGVIPIDEPIEIGDNYVIVTGL